VTKLEQRYLFIPPQVKDCYLYSLLTDFSEKGSMIIFVATCKYAQKAAGARGSMPDNPTSACPACRGCESLGLTIRELGFQCTALHSKMPQNERLASLAKFRSSLVPILVATDVASR
jgi:ATP-dependent RNA helicase DDX49/DBP8